MWLKRNHHHELQDRCWPGWVQVTTIHVESAEK